MKDLDAINQILRTRSVSLEIKHEAIVFILQGVDCQKVVKAINDIQDTLEAFEALNPERKV
jgi:hypothetical protein